MLRAEHAVLAESLHVGLDDLANLLAMPRRIEHDHDQQLGSLTNNEASRIAMLALDVQHAQAIRETRRDAFGKERSPLGIAHLAATRLVATEIQVDLERRLQRWCATAAR